MNDSDLVATPVLRTGERVKDILNDHRRRRHQARFRRMPRMLRGKNVPLLLLIPVALGTVLIPELLYGWLSQSYVRAGLSIVGALTIELGVLLITLYGMGVLDSPIGADDGSAPASNYLDTCIDRCQLEQETVRALAQHPAEVTPLRESLEREVGRKKKRLALLLGVSGNAGIVPVGAALVTATIFAPKLGKDPSGLPIAAVAAAIALGGLYLVGLGELEKRLDIEDQIELLNLAEASSHSDPPEEAADVAGPEPSPAAGRGGTDANGPVGDRLRDAPEDERPRSTPSD